MNAALLYALAAAGATVLGGFVIVGASAWGRIAQRLLIAFGAGYMLAVALVAMVPHAVEHGGNAVVWIVVGYLLVHLTQHVLTPHFHFGEERHPEAMVGRWVGVSALLGLLLHAFFDGVAIASGFGISASLGVLVFTGIVLHKVPEGVTIASIMLASGNSRTAAMVGVFLLGFATVLGVLLTAYMGPLQQHGLALSAGVTIYVAASNLIPEIQREHGWTMPASLFLGVGTFFAARLLVTGLHP